MISPGRIGDRLELPQLRNGVFAGSCPANTSDSSSHQLLQPACVPQHCDPVSSPASVDRPCVAAALRQSAVIDDAVDDAGDRKPQQRDRRPAECRPQRPTSRCPTTVSSGWKWENSSARVSLNHTMIRRSRDPLRRVDQQCEALVDRKAQHQEHPQRVDVDAGRPTIHAGSRSLSRLSRHQRLTSAAAIRIQVLVPTGRESGCSSVGLRHRQWHRHPHPRSGSPRRGFRTRASPPANIFQAR